MAEFLPKKIPGAVGKILPTDREVRTRSSNAFTDYICQEVYKDEGVAG